MLRKALVVLATTLALSSGFSVDAMAHGGGGGGGHGGGGGGMGGGHAGGFGGGGFGGHAGGFGGGGFGGHAGGFGGGMGGHTVSVGGGFGHFGGFASDRGHTSPTRVSGGYGRRYGWNRGYGGWGDGGWYADCGYPYENPSYSWCTY